MGTITPVKATNSAYTKKTKSTRAKVEKKLSGNNISATPPESLTQDQQEIYKFLYENLSPTGVLSNLDIPVILNACVVIDRLYKIDAEIEKTGFNLEFIKLQKELTGIRNIYFGMFKRTVAELCLSPAARAKMGAVIANTLKDKEDELLKALTSIADD